MNQRVYPNSRLGSTSLGEKADIEKATVADLRRYYDEWYRPNNATLTVAGDVHAADVFAEAERSFGAIAAAKLPERRHYALKPATGASYTRKSDFPYTIVDEAYAAPGNAKPYEHDQVRNDVALGAMFNPRGPFRTLVESGLVLGYNPTPLEDRRASVVHVMLIVAPGHTPGEVRAAYEKMMASLLAKGLDPDLFAASKRSELAAMTYARDSIVGIGDAIGANMVFPGDTDPSEFEALYGAITRDESTAVARRVYAKASVVAMLQPTAFDPSKAKAPESVSSSVSDNFGNRTSNGPLVQPAWMQAALAKPLTLRSAVDPVVTTLPNGMRLLVQRVATNPTVFIDGLVRTSASFDPRGKEGLGEVTSSLMDWGSAKYDYDAQRKLADDRAAELSFGTSFAAHGRATRLRGAARRARRRRAPPAAPGRQVRRWCKLAARRVHRPPRAAGRLRSAAAVRRRAVSGGRSRAARRDGALDPVAHARRRQGVSRAVRAPRSHHARGRRRRRTGPGRAEVQRAFGDWTASGAKPDPHLPAIPLPPPTDAPRHDRHAGRHRAARRARAGTHSPDYDPLTLANAIYGGERFAGVAAVPRGAREARSRLRRDRARSQRTATAVRSPSRSARCPRRSRRPRALVRAELKRMQTDDVSAEELARAKTRVVATQLNAEQATSSIAGDLLRIGLDDLRPRTMRRLPNATPRSPPPT